MTVPPCTFVFAKNTDARGDQSAARRNPRQRCRCALSCATRHGDVANSQRLLRFGEHVIRATVTTCFFRVGRMATASERMTRKDASEYSPISVLFSRIDQTVVQLTYLGDQPVDSAAEAAMMLRVREKGDVVFIDVDGVAGRQQRVLQALTECQRRVYGTTGAPSVLAGINVRAGANMMRIRLTGREGLRFEATAIYQCLREALLRSSVPASAGHPTT